MKPVVIYGSRANDFVFPPNHPIIPIEMAWMDQADGLGFNR